MAIRGLTNSSDHHDWIANPVKKTPAAGVLCIMERINLTYFVLIVIFLCTSPESVKAQDSPAPLPVQIVTVQAVTLERHLSLTGEIEARDLLSASFSASGRIVELVVEQGDHVAKGKVLARLDSTLQEQALRSAEAALDTARANAQKAQEDADRQDRLLVSGATARSARDAAADDLRAANATVAQAEANLDRARQALDDTVLRSPSDATITAKPTGIGQVVANAQTVLELAIGGRYDAVFQLPETLLAFPPDSRPRQVFITSLNEPRDTVIGTVRLISPLVDATLGTVKVTVTMPKLPTGLQIGDPVIGTVTWPEPSQIELPWASLSAQGGKPAVWVVDPDTHRASLRQIEVLRYETERVVVAGGLNDGEQVVGFGSNLLYPDRSVRAVEGN